MSGSEIVIKIGGDSKDLVEETKKVKKVLGDLGSDASKAPTTANIAWGSFIGNLASQATTAVLSKLGDLFGWISAQAINFAKAAEEDNVSLGQLNIALAQTGQYTKENAAAQAEYIDKLEKSSKYSGPAIANAAALVQQMSVLSGETSRATQLTADFASAMRMDIESAAKIVGKALSGDVAALKRYGIELEVTGDKQKDAAKALDILSARFSGAAVAAIQNATGAYGQLQNKYDDIGKSIFGQINSNSALIGSMQGIAEVFKILQKIVEENKQGISDFVTGGVMFLVDGISVAGKTIAWFVGLAGDFQQFSKFIDDAVLATIQTFFELQAGVGNVAANIKEFFGGNADGIREYVKQAENSIEGFKKAREENDAETAKLIANNEAKVQSITDFSIKAEEIVRERVMKAQEAEKEETNNYLTELNARAVARQEAAVVETEEQIAKREYEALANEENLARIQEVLGREAALREQSRNDDLVKEGKYGAALKNLKAAQVKAEQESIFAVQKYEDLSQKQRLANLQSTLGTVAQLQGQSSKELFLIGKAAAISQATIDGWQGVQKALASAPPPFNFALAAAVGIVAAMNISRIASTPAPTGAFDGALVGDGSGYKDDQPFMLSRGELVAPARSFDDVVEGTARQRGFVKKDEIQQSSDGRASVVEIMLKDDFLEFVERGLQQRRALGITAQGDFI